MVSLCRRKLLVHWISLQKKTDSRWAYIPAEVMFYIQLYWTSWFMKSCNTNSFPIFFRFVNSCYYREYVHKICSLRHSWFDMFVYWLFWDTSDFDFDTAVWSQRKKFGLLWVIHCNCNTRNTNLKPLMTLICVCILFCILVWPQLGKPPSFHVLGL